MRHWPMVILAGLIGAITVAANAEPSSSPPAKAGHEAQVLNELPPITPKAPLHIDTSGRKQKGRASYYSKHFDHRTMADGKRMDPHSNVAASRTLPLGTTAKVVNLDNGKDATVKVEDRGPYVKGRVMDLSPAVAARLDMKKVGVAPVVVKPITVPQPDGQVKLGAGAAEATPAQVKHATEVTKALAGNAPTQTAEK